MKFLPNKKYQDRVSRVVNGCLVTQNKADDRNEEIIRKALSDIYGMEVEKCKGSHVKVDWKMSKNGVLTGFAESKTRYNWRNFSTVYFSEDKFEQLEIRQLVHGLHLKIYMVYGFQRPQGEDAIGILDLQKHNPRKEYSLELRGANGSMADGACKVMKEPIFLVPVKDLQIYPLNSLKCFDFSTHSPGSAASATQLKESSVDLKQLNLLR